MESFEKVSVERPFSLGHSEGTEEWFRRPEKLSKAANSACPLLALARVLRPAH